MTSIQIAPVDPQQVIRGRLEDKVLLITGGADGIGGACAARAAREGAWVVAVDRKADVLRETVRAINAEVPGSADGRRPRAIAIVADVAVTADAERMVAEAVRVHRRLDLALNAAGVMDGTDPAEPQDFDRDVALQPASLHRASDAYWDAVLASNATGMFKSLRAELAQLVAQGHGGAIVNIGSIAALTGLPGNPAYSASKHAVTGLTRNAAIDYAPSGIRVNSVNMAQTDTPMVTRAYEFVKHRQAQGAGSGMAGAKAASLLTLAAPDHRGSTRWEQAAIILFLLSDEASNLTGACLATDGGWTSY